MSESEDQHVTTGQIAELLAIDRAGPGFRRQFQTFIRGLSRGGVEGSKTSAKAARRFEALRQAQALRYWNLNVEFGSVWVSGFDLFEDYLETLPSVPEALQREDPEFPLLVLVEPRYSLRRLCMFVGIQFGGDDDTFVVYDQRHEEFSAPTWIRVQDGRRNSGRTVRDCRKSFGERERGLTAHQGVCLYVQHRKIWGDLNSTDGHALDLAGSVHRGDRNDAAWLDVVGDQVELGWDCDSNARPRCGSASRRA